MKKKLYVFILLTAFVFFLPAQDHDFKIKTDVNWERGLIRIRVENQLNPEIFVIQESKLQANQEMQKAFPRVLLMALKPIVVNSQKTVKDLVFEDLNYLNIIETLSQETFLEASYLNKDLTSLINEYNVPLYSDFTKIFVNHDAPIPIRPYLQFTAADDYTAIIIVATGKLPVYGKAEAAALQPALFPKILDSKGETLLSQENFDTQILTKRGAVTYHPDGTELTEIEVGKNPFRILATGIFGLYHTDIVIQESDAQKLLSRTNNIELLKSGNIHIICNSDSLNLTQTTPLKK